MHTRNLLIVHTPALESLSDWEGVKARVELAAPDIEVRIVDNLKPDAGTAGWQASRPSLVFSSYELVRYRPPGGKIYCGRPYDKLEQAARLAAAGVPVIPGALLTPSFRPDKTWGPFLVVKPVNGRAGEGVRLVRASDIGRRAAELASGDAALMVQPFVDHIDLAGRPFEFRVLLAFGRPLYASRNSWPVARAGPEKIVDLPNGLIASNTEAPGRRTRTTVDDKAVLALAGRAAAVFPELPTVAVDIILPRSGGHLVVEVNPRGESWHLSSAFARRNFTPEHRAELYRQFGALDVLADALVARTRVEAV